MRMMLLVLAAMIFTTNAFADSYSCARMVYAGGWLKKYNYLGNTWGANTKKSGALSSTINATVEKTTSSVDPGVSTQNLVSTVQYSSSWGDCSMLEYNITKQMREDYIDQNLNEIKSEVAMGDGIHVDSIAFVSGCHGINETQWKKGLQAEAVHLYDQKDAKGFVKVLDEFIANQKDLRDQCQLAQI